MACRCSEAGTTAFENTPPPPPPPPPPLQNINNIIKKANTNLWQWFYLGISSRPLFFAIFLFLFPFAMKECVMCVSLRLSDEILWYHDTTILGLTLKRFSNSRLTLKVLVATIDALGQFETA